MVNIEAGVAEATIETFAVRVMTLVRSFFVLPYTRPVFVNITKTFMQGRTSMSAVSPDNTLNGGKAVA